jgi:DNA-binding winged helix-turn-helix (wHTH) protein
MQGYRIGRFILDIDRRQVLSDERPIGLTPKNFELFYQLAKAEGALVPRDELAKLVWPDTLIEEATLRQNVYSLRTLLREADAGCEYLENVPKVGYRIAVPVERINGEVPPQPLAPPPLIVDRARRLWFLVAALAMLFLTALALARAFKTNGTQGAARQESTELIRQGWLTLDSRDVERFPAVLRLFDDALGIDPHSASAHAGKAVLFLLWNKEKDAEAEAARAEALDPKSGASLAVRGFMKMMYWDWGTAGVLLEEAGKRPCPDSFCHQWYGFYLGFTGQFSRAVREMAAAVERNPSGLAPRAAYGQILYWAGQNDAALRELQTVVDASGSATHARLHLWKAQLAARDRQLASRTLLLAIDPTGYRSPAEDEFRQLGTHADLFGTPEFFTRLLAISERLNTNAYFLAEIAMAGGDEKKALDQLERAFQAHIIFVPYAKRDPLFVPLRDDPRYQAIMKQVGL